MIIKWDKKQFEMLNKMSVPFDVQKDLNDDELEELYDIVPDFMLGKAGWDGKNEPGADFLLCEDIVTVLAGKMKERGLLA